MLKEYTNTCHICKRRGSIILPENYTSQDMYCAELQMQYKYGWLDITFEDKLKGLQFLSFCPDCLKLLMNRGKVLLELIEKFKNVDFNSMEMYLTDSDGNIIGESSLNRRVENKDLGKQDIKR